MKILAWPEYKKRFVWDDGRCPFCGKVAAAAPRWMWLEREQERLKNETRLVR